MPRYLYDLTFSRTSPPSIKEQDEVCLCFIESSIYLHFVELNLSDLDCDQARIVFISFWISDISELQHTILDSDMSSANLVRGLSSKVVISLMYMLKRIGPRIEP